MNYRSIDQLNKTIRSKLSIIPKDVDLIIGVPRSGMLPATIIALLLNKPLITINDLTCPSINSFTTRKIKFLNEYKKALIVDDSCFTGASINRVKQFITEHLSRKIEALYCCIYVTDESTSFVDLYFEICNQPRVFEWNIMNHLIITQSCLDLDGVLCVDPTEEENDDGPKYLNFIENATPLFIPEYEIGAIVTSRLEKYREATESWLKKNNVKYKSLIMLDVPDKETRIRLGLHGVFKANIYQNSEAALFIESDDGQAQYIYASTNKPVYCTGSNRFYNRDSSFDVYARIMQLGKAIEEKAYNALSIMYNFHDRSFEIINLSTHESACYLFNEYLSNLSKIFDEVCQFSIDNSSLGSWISNYIYKAREIINNDISNLPDYFLSSNLKELETLIDASIHDVILTAASKVSTPAWNEEHFNTKKELFNNIINNDLDMDGFEKEVGFLKKRGELVLYPYDFINKYDESKVTVYEEQDLNLKYVKHRDKKLFFPPKDSSLIKSEYNQLIMEQDEESPHHYFSENCSFSEGDIFVDVGAAEGIISLDVIEKAKEIYLIECSEEWIKALKATFSDWMDKVHIIKKYAGRTDNDTTITLDTLLRNYSSENIFIKIDAEGMELDILKGSERILLNNNCKLSCATYHTGDQAQELRLFFNNLAYNSCPSNNYILFFYGKMVLDNGYYEHIKKPYFRHALVRAWKE